jgi:tetratricopeptide (TPR) repeat protein
MISSPMQRGLTAAKAQKPAEAAEWFRKAHEAAPSDPTPKAWLGQALCALGGRAQGQALLREAGRQFLQADETGQPVDNALEVIGRLQHWGDYEGALGLCRLAAVQAPGDPRAQHLLAVTCGQLNLTAEALAAAERALALQPGHRMMQVLQGSLHADAGDYAAARRRLEQVLDARPGARESLRAHKELARVLNALDETDGAFAHLQAAAALASQLPEFRVHDPRLAPHLIDANLAGYDADLLGRWRMADLRAAPRAPAFVVGFYRSGTTLTQQVLAAHPDVFVADEAGLIAQVQAELHRMDPAAGSIAQKAARLDQAGVLRLRQAYWASARARYGADVDAPVFVDKFTMNIVDVGFINVIFPDARVIVMLRDPRDACLSCFMQLMVPSPTTIHLLTWPGTAALYHRVMDWWLDIRDRLTLPVLEVRYEDAVAAFEPTYRRVLQFLGLSWDARVADFHRQARGRFVASPSRNQVSRPLYASSVGRWRRYEAQFPPVADLLDPFVEAFGYAP